MKYVECIYFLSWLLSHYSNEKYPTLEVVSKGLPEKIRFRPKPQVCVGIYQWRRGKNIPDYMVKEEMKRYILRMKNVWITRIWSNIEKEEGQAS